MVRFKTMRLCTLIFTFALTLGTAHSQNQPIYAVVSYVKSNPEVSQEQKDFLETYRKVQRKKVDEGKMIRWAFYKVANNNGSADQYNYISAAFFEGNSQLASNYTQRDISDYSSDLSPNEKKLLDRSKDYLQITHEKVFLFRDALGDLSGFPDVMWMQYFKLRKGKKFDDLLELDKNLNASSFQNNIDNKHLTTFQSYQQLLPSGSDSKVDLVRIFGFEDFEQMLNFPVRNNMAFFKQNPDFAKVDFTLGVTSLVKEEAWQLLECSCEN